MADLTAVIIFVAGFNVTTYARVGSVRISDILNDAPNSAAVTLRGDKTGAAISGAFASHAFNAAAFQTTGTSFTDIVRPGAPIQIYLGVADVAHQIFGGQIITNTNRYEVQRPANVRYDLTCTDFTRRLNRRKVLKAYPAASATAIVLDVIAWFTGGITTANVQSGLPTIEGGITFTFEEPSRALSRIAEKIGGYWYVDYVGDLHFFTGNEPGTDPAPIVPGADFADFRYTADLTQVRTRVLVEGQGTTSRTVTGAGSASVPIVDPAPFNVGGGLAVADGAQRFAYGSMKPGGGASAVVGTLQNPAAPSGSQNPGAGSMVAGTYKYAVSFMYGTRESDGGALSAGVLVQGVSAPAAAPTAAISGAGGVPPGSHVYRVTFATPTGETTPGPNSSALNVPTLPLAAFVYTGATPTTGGAIAPGDYEYAMSFVTATGEGPAALRTVPITVGGANNAIALTGLETSSDPRVTGRRLYRCLASVGAAGLKLVTNLPPTGATFTDTKAEASLGGSALDIFTATGQNAGVSVALTAIPTAIDGRVTARRIYRDGLLCGEIPNNTATTFTDDGKITGAAAPPAVNTAITGAVNVAAIPIGPPGTTARRLYRTAVNGAEAKLLDTIADNATTTYTDTKPDAALGVSKPALSGIPIPAGATAIAVLDTAPFSDPGWILIGEQVIFFETRSAASGPGNLAGIPSGQWGLIAPVIPGDAVIQSASLHVPDRIALPIPLDGEINLLAQCDDLAAQAAIAAVEGGDGVIEHYIQDRRLSLTSATARGNAELALFKTVEIKAQYTTYDPQTRSGRIVHIDVPAPQGLTGDFLIQTVTIDDVSIAKNHFPKRHVEASTTRFSFEDVLNRLLMESL